MSSEFNPINEPLFGKPESKITSTAWIMFFQKLIKALSVINSGIFTGVDLRLYTSSKGVIMTNAAGTITKRVRLNNTGDGLIYEDP